MNKLPTRQKIILLGAVLVLVMLLGFCTVSALAKPNVIFVVPINTQDFSQEVVFKIQIVDEDADIGCRKSTHLVTSESELICPPGLDRTAVEIIAEEYLLPYPAVRNNRVLIHSEAIQLGEQYALYYGGKDAQDCNTISISSHGKARVSLMPIYFGNIEYRKTARHCQPLP